MHSFVSDLGFLLLFGCFGYMYMWNVNMLLLWLSMSLEESIDSPELDLLVPLSHSQFGF